MILYTLAATARMQGTNPTALFQQLLLAPPDAPSPLAASPLPSAPLLSPAL